MALAVALARSAEVMTVAHAIPEHAVWFRVERKTGKEWRPIMIDRQQWFSVEAGGELDVVANTGHPDGTFRTLYTAEDKRRRRVHSPPWTVAERVAEEAEVNENQIPAGQDPIVDDEANRAQHEPAASTPPRGPDPAGPPKAKRRKPRAYDMPTMDPSALAPAEGVTLHPLGQFVYLESLTQQRGDKFHALLLQAMSMQIENERSRAQEYRTTLERHYAEMEASRREFMAAVMSLNGDRTSPELAKLAATVEKLADEVAELGDEEPPEIDPAALAKLSDNPNDLERALAAVQNIVNAVANSPIGSALAERLREAGAPLPPE